MVCGRQCRIFRPWSARIDSEARPVYFASPFNAGPSRAVSRRNAERACGVDEEKKQFLRNSKAETVGPNGDDAKSREISAVDETFADRGGERRRKTAPTTAAAGLPGDFDFFADGSIDEKSPQNIEAGPITPGFRRWVESSPRNRDGL